MRGFRNSESINFEHTCIDDFAGNYHQESCWADLYKSLPNTITNKCEYYIIANAAYQHTQGYLPEMIYGFKLSKQEYNRIQKTTDKSDFDYDWLGKTNNKRLTNHEIQLIQQ